LLLDVEHQSNKEITKMIKHKGLFITYLSENSITIIGKDNTTHWVEKHFKHTLWTKSGSDNISNSLKSKIMLRLLIKNDLPWQL
jgi:hypothetical protein